MADDAGNNRLRSLKQGLHQRDLRTTIIQFLTGVANFAIDSTIFTSLSAVAGKNRKHKIRQEGLKNASHLPSLNEKKPEELKLLMDKKMQAEMEEGEEHNSGMKQHHCTSAKIVDGSQPLKKLPGEDDKGSANVMENKKRIFIRSRL